MKSLTDPGAGKQEKEAKEARIKAWKAPKEGDTVNGKKLTKTTVKKQRDALREERKKDWERAYNVSSSN